MSIGSLLAKSGVVRKCFCQPVPMKDGCGPIPGFLAGESLAPVPILDCLGWNLEIYWVLEAETLPGVAKSFAAEREDSAGVVALVSGKEFCEAHQIIDAAGILGQFPKHRFTCGTSRKNGRPAIYKLRVKELKSVY